MEPTRQFDSFFKKTAGSYVAKKMEFGAEPSRTMPITTDCQNCDSTISVNAKYDPNWNSVTYSCPSCKQEASEHNWVENAHTMNLKANDK